MAGEAYTVTSVHPHPGVAAQRVWFGPPKRCPPGFIDGRLLLGAAPEWGGAAVERAVEEVHAAGFVETLSQAEALAWLIACRRMLRPEATMRITTLDLDAIVATYTTPLPGPDSASSADYWLATRCERLNMQLRSGRRRWVYSEEELCRLAELAGLEMVRRHPPPAAQPLLLDVELRKPSRLLSVDASPLVSILMPTFSPRYFEAALRSARAQTYREIEIVIGDDCPDDAIRRIVQSVCAGEPRVRYQRNAERLGGRANLIACFGRARGEFIKCLNDDDLLAPECVERMLECFRRHPDLTLVTSRRRRIDEDGSPLPDARFTVPPVDVDSRVDGLSAGCALVTTGTNFVGEPTTPMFRKREVEHLRPDFMSIDGRPVRGIMDVALWLNLSTRGDFAYLVDPLSSFRVHAEQQQQRDRAEVLRWYQESMSLLRFAWTRLGLLKAFPENRLRVQQLADPAGPWSKRPAVPV